ncbi:MAG: nitrile hydratase subunit beta [Gammaproteobacteria bacterium]|nr:nitrile hydratase subunit beta [Gammaproteobacteria bacterium]MCP5201912.1 nitrile hydratase subunit beta [Gammaproteobacteria bacterium]
MNGIHDLGGAQDYGPVYTETNEPPFHYDWERRVLGLFPALFASGAFHVDEFRHAIERMGPIEYLQGTYYEHWLHAFETLLVEKGFVSAGELASGKPAAARTATPALVVDGVAPLLATGASARMAEEKPPRFAVGDEVRVVNRHPTGHTRIPRYARGRRGTIALDHGAFVYPDTVAHGRGPHPQHVYSVSFAARELWGADAAPHDTVRIDLWDDYLEAP